MNSINVFEIQDGVLIRCNSNGSSVEIPDCVTSISEKAFIDCSDMINLTIPDSVKSIKTNALSNCKNLKNIYADDLIGFSNLRFGNALGWLTKERYNLFIKGTLITELTIPSSVTSVGEQAFYRCASLASVMIPEGVTQIGEGAFSACCNLTGVTIPDSVTRIGESAFSDCCNLINVTIPDGVTSIEESAFRDCSSLTSITIPNGTMRIGEYAFARCTGLMDVTIPESVTYIDDAAFRGCSSLSSITLPESLTGIGWRAFQDCSSLKNIVVPDGVTSFGGDDYSRAYGENIFPDSAIVILSEYIKGIEKRDVAKKLVFRKTPIQGIKSTNAKVLAVNGFLAVDDLSIYDVSVVESYKKYLKGKVINYMDFILENDTAQIISKLASFGLLDSKFVGKMMEQDLPDEVKMILSEQADKKQGEKEEASRKKAPSVGELKKYWSYTKNELGITITSYKDFDSDVVIPERIGKEEVTEVGESAFSPDKTGISDKQRDIRMEITSVTIPDNVISIGCSAFSGCRSLETIVIPDQVTIIGQAAFDGCYKLREIRIPYGVFTINAYTFDDCRSLSSVTIPNSVTSIGAGAFSRCSSLTKIVIPDSVTDISDWAFRWCKDLKIYAPSGSFAEEYAAKQRIPFIAL